MQDQKVGEREKLELHISISGSFSAIGCDFKRQGQSCNGFIHSSIHSFMQQMLHLCQTLSWDLVEPSVAKMPSNTFLTELTFQRERAIKNTDSTFINAILWSKIINVMGEIGKQGWGLGGSKVQVSTIKVCYS